MVGGALRRVAAVVVTATLLGLVAGDLWDRAMRSWWAGHGLTASAVSSLLVVGVSALIFDELVARRQRKARALSVAVQAVIVFGQTRRAFDAVMARLDNPSAADAVEDVRGLATMLLAASPTFFDDPDALRFLEQVERLVGHMVAALAAAAKGSSSAEQRAKVTSEMARARLLAQPLLGRIPAEDWPGGRKPRLDEESEDALRDD